MPLIICISIRDVGVVILETEQGQGVIEGGAGPVSTGPGPSDVRRAAPSITLQHVTLSEHNMSRRLNPDQPGSLGFLIGLIYSDYLRSFSSCGRFALSTC